MSLGNQYGIELGNILSTASSLKTAKLARENAKKREARAERTSRNKERRARTNHLRKIAKEDAGEANIKNFIKSGKSGVNVSDENIDNYAKNPNVFNLRYKQSKSDEAVRVKKEQADALIQSRTAANIALLRRTMPNATEEEIQAMAGTKTATLGKFITAYEKANKATKKAQIDNVNAQMRKLMMVTQSEDPEKAYTLYRDEMIQQNPNFAKTLKPTYDPNAIAYQLGESAEVFKAMQKMRLEEEKEDYKRTHPKTSAQKDLKHYEKELEIKNKKAKELYDYKNKVDSNTQIDSNESENDNALSWRDKMIEAIGGLS